MIEFLQQFVNGLIIGMTYSLVAIGLTMTFGLMNVINFAHGEFYMLGGFIAYYVVALMNMGFYISALIAVLATMVGGLITERLLIRRLRGRDILTTAIVTIGLSMFLQNTGFIIMGPIPKSIPSPFEPVPIYIGQITVAPARLLAAAVSIIIISFTHLAYNYTKVGRALKATLQDRDAALLAGINTNTFNMWTFAYGSALAAVAGVLLGAMFVVTPFMGEAVIAKAWVVVIVGGLGNIMGAVLGGLLLGVAETLGAGFISAGYKDAIGFFIVILVLFFKPTGLWTKSTS